MHLRSLRVFCDVVRRRSFSLAAVDNCMTQSAASQAVQQIEESLDLQLIDRSRRPFILTPDGQRFFDGVSLMLRQYDSLLDELKHDKEEVKGHVAIASIYSVGLSYLPAIEETFRLQYPEVEYDVKYAQPNEVYRLVEQGTVDFGLISYPEQTKAVQMIHWRDEKMVIIASPRHKLASQPEVAPKALSQCAFVAFAPELRIRQEVDRHLRALDIRGRVSVELDNIDSIKNAVTVNSGLGIVPERTVRQEVATGTLRIIKCPLFEMIRPLGIIQRRGMPVSRAARAFIEALMSDAAAQLEVDTVNNATVATKLPAAAVP